jgi:hypothetical protein
MHVVLCIYMPPHLIVAASIWRATRLQVTDTSHACCFVHLHATTPHCGCFNLACNTITGDRHKPCILFCRIYMPPDLIVAASIWRATRLQVTDTSHACANTNWGATRLQVTDTSHACCFVHLHATRPHCGCFNLGCNTITGDRHKPCILFCAFAYASIWRATRLQVTDTSHACHHTSLWLLQSGVQHDYR